MRSHNVDAINHSFGLGAGIEATPRGRPKPRPFPLVFAPCEAGTGWWRPSCGCLGCVAVTEWCGEKR